MYDYQMSEHSSIPRIHILDSEVYNQIAAGEVIERPSSVVKELIENALDASATRINIQLKQGGIQLIRITDNGHGIHPDDLPLSIESHTTSKLISSADLSNINSFGFRGEALASIASVSKFRIQSSMGDSRLGKELQFLSDRKSKIIPCAHPRGTTVEVQDLFFNTPARKKFLRSVNTEYQHILGIIKLISLCHFDINFKLQHNDRVTLNLTDSKEDYTRRLYEIFGKEFTDNVFALDFKHDDMRLWGWLGKPNIARNQTDKQYLYINRRPIRDKHIQHAIRLAFQDHLYPGRYPCYALFFELEPSLLDVNVHPGKQEVRFQQPRNIHDFIHHCLSQVLDNKTDSNAYSIPVPGDEVNDFDTEVKEPVVEYLQSHSTKKKQNLKYKIEPGNYIEINNRYCIHKSDGGFLLIDLHIARKQLTKEIINFQYQRNQQVINRPLLIPYEYQNTPENIDLVEQYENTLAKLGISFRRNSPEQIMIRKLPECVRYMDIRQFFNEMLDTVAKLKESVDVQDFIKLISIHCNDQLPDKTIQ